MRRKNIPLPLIRDWFSLEKGYIKTKRQNGLDTTQLCLQTNLEHFKCEML